MIIGIDVDDTICRTMRRLLQLCNEEYGTAYIEEDMVHWDLSSNVPSYIDIDKFWSYGDRLYGPDTDEEEGALEVIKWLKSLGCEIVYVTRASVNSYDPKIKWLTIRGFTTYGPVWITNCDKKTRINVDIMIDDSPEVVWDFIRSGRIGVIYTKPWNREEDLLIRLNHWSDLMKGGDPLTYLINHYLRREPLDA